MAFDLDPDLRPSDTVIWRYSKHGDRCWLDRLNRRAPLLVDNGPKSWGLQPELAQSWHAVIKCNRDWQYNPMIEFGPDDKVWTLYTEGNAGPGGRRYRHHLTLSEAQTLALRWLDRRFAVQAS